MKKNYSITNWLPVAFFLCLLIFSCQLKQKDNWNPPEFVKEWEIEETIPGLKPYIVSITANQHGVFALIRMIEAKYSPPPNITKKASEMTEEEKEEIFYQYPFFSASILQKMTKGEKDELIGFFIKYFMPPRKANEMTEGEKEDIINFVMQHKETKDTEINIKLFREGLKKKGRDKYIDGFYENIQKAIRRDIEHYRILQYDFEGNFVTQWPEGNKLTLSDQLKAGLKPLFISRHNIPEEKPEIDIRGYLVKPLIIASDGSGNIFLADYQGNKIVRFDRDGNVINLWWIEQPKAREGFYEDLDSHHGLFLSGDRLYLVSQGYDNQFGSGPRISEFGLDGKLLRRKTIKPPKVPGREGVSGKKTSSHNEDGEVNGIIVDAEGNLYLFSPDTTILMLDREWNEKGQIETILSKGFEKPRPIYSPDLKREVTYRDWLSKDESFEDFSSDQYSWIETRPWFYFANGMHQGPDGRLYVTMTGMKPFGVIDAMIFDKRGKMVGYWKRDQKSYLPWFEALTDFEKSSTTETGSEMAFHGNQVFIGKNFYAGTSGSRRHTVIQKFARRVG